MFGFSRGNKSAATKRPTARLNLETLESRDVPTALTLNVTYNGGTSVTLSGTLSGTPVVSGQTVEFSGNAWGYTTTDANGHYTMTENAAGLGMIGAMVPAVSVGTTGSLTDSGATITSFTATETPGSWWEFKGSFTYNYTISGMTLTLNGAPVDIRNLKYNLDGSGTFDEWIQLDGNQDDNGGVGAVVTDAWGVTSNVAVASVHQTGT